MGFLASPTSSPPTLPTLILGARAPLAKASSNEMALESVSVLPHPPTPPRLPAELLPRPRPWGMGGGWPLMLLGSPSCRAAEREDAAARASLNLEDSLDVILVLVVGSIAMGSISSPVSSAMTAALNADPDNPSWDRRRSEGGVGVGPGWLEGIGEQTSLFPHPVSDDADDEKVVPSTVVMLPMERPENRFTGLIGASPMTPPLPRSPPSPPALLEVDPIPTPCIPNTAAGGGRRGEGHSGLMMPRMMMMPPP